MLVFRGVPKIAKPTPNHLYHIRQFTQYAWFRTVVAFFSYFLVDGRSDHAKTRCFCASFDNFKYSTSVIHSCQVHFLEEKPLSNGVQ